MNDHEETSPRGGTLPGLDGLRAVAVFLVILCHQEILGMGWLGVQMFFVLSGYLITRLLHRGTQAPIGSYLRNFYGRRALRIFPLYYGYLAAVSLTLLFGLNPTGVAERLPFAFAYLTNFYEAATDSYSSKLLTHFWSLAVEEQFYLVWPFLIYFCPPRVLRHALISIVLLGPLLRFSVASSFNFPGYLAIAHVDAFAVGALSSLFPLKLGARTRLAAALAFAVVGLWLLSNTAPIEHGALGYGYIFGCSFFNVATALVIEALVKNQFLPAFFEHGLMRYLGKISYGLYVFHYPVQSLVERAVPSAPILVRLAVQLAVTVAISAASFAFYESRFLALKERWFPATVRPVVQRVGVT